MALVAHDVHDSGGMERACAELIRHGSNDVDFCVISSELAPQLRPLVHQWIRIDTPTRPFPLKFAVFWIRAGIALRRVDVDLIHSVGAIVPNRVDLASIHFCHTGFVAKSHRFVPQDTPLHRRVNTAFSRSLALLAERWSYRPGRLRSFGAVSQGVADELGHQFASVPCAVTPNGADLSLFRPNGEVRMAIRSAEGAAPTTTVALFVGGDWGRKGLKIAIAALAGVRATGEDVELWVVGKGDRVRFERFSAEQGVAPHVHFHGIRKDTDRFYQAADLFVLPSAYETFSLVCFEAAACGLPLVIPPISGAREIVGANEGGCLSSDPCRRSPLPLPA